MESVTFNCCKHLDHTEGNYVNCVLKNCMDWYVYWERGEAWTEGGRNPRDVQFCSKRGRLNYKSACIEGCAECLDYEDEQRTIEIN